MRAASTSRGACWLALLLTLVAAPAGAEADGGLLSLDRALSKAAASNEDVGILAEHVTQARAVRLQVLSGMLPWLSASANLGFTDEVAFATEEGSRVVVPGTDWGWGGQITLKLLDLSLYPSLAAAGKNVDASEALLDYGTDEVLFATAQAYVTALFAQAAVTVRERELDTRVKRREEVEARMQADQALALDLQRAELQVLMASQALESARVDAVLAMDALCLLMGEEPGTVWELAPLDAKAVPLEAPGEPGASGQIDLAIGERADLDAQELALKAAKAGKVSGWLGLVPTLSVSASYDQGPKSFRSPDGYTWMVSFNLSWSIFDGGYTAGKIKESASKSSEALLELDKAQKQVESELRNAWLKFNLGLANRETAVKQVEVATTAYEMAEERYRAGVSTGLEVDDALDALAEAEIGLLGQEMNLQLAWLAYLRASGQFGTFFEVS